jgi:nitroimidazol reductase NimA-like FMN-containing flavoprotein (pyridoxamine 5'-phosphate oxidase superfamily)
MSEPEKTEDKMVDDLKQAEKYLREIRIPLRLSCTTKTGWPMIVSLWFLYQDNKLLCATQNSAKVVSYLQNEPRCAFEISADLPPYCGVRGQAIARIDEEIGGEVLKRLLERYLGGTDNQLAKTLLSKRETEVAIILDPKNIFSWDFSKRMTNMSFEQPFGKICP